MYMSITTLQTIMYKLIINLLKFIKEEKLNKRGQSGKKGEISCSTSNSSEKFLFSSFTFLFLTLQSF